MRDPHLPDLSKDQRMELFFEELRLAPATGSFEEAYHLVVSTLNSIEDEHCGVPFNPDRWREDGRLYPLHADMARPATKNPQITVFRSRAHRTYITPNGAIVILDIPNNRVIISKNGKDGKAVPNAALD